MISIDRPELNWKQSVEYRMKSARRRAVTTAMVAGFGEWRGRMLRVKFDEGRGRANERGGRAHSGNDQLPTREVTGARKLQGFH